MDAESLRRAVLELWCPLGGIKCSPKCLDVPHLRTALWTRCPGLRPEGLEWSYMWVLKRSAEGCMVTPLPDHGAHALIGWKCIEWIRATNDYWVELGNALKAYDLLTALIGLCHRILDQREELEAEDAMH